MVAPHFAENGRPSIDPVLMIKMMIVGYRRLTASVTARGGLIGNLPQGFTAAPEAA